MDRAGQHAWLRAMGIAPWLPRRATAPVKESTAARAPDVPAPAVEAPVSAGADVAGMDWQQLDVEVAGCQACPLCEGRTQTVFGVGRHDARLMVVGEAPGAEEDRRGEPFVGRAGRLLDSMLFAMGYPRVEVFIANVVKCRPPGNRDPAPEEVAACRPYLDRQIAMVAPELIIAVGRVAAQRLLGTDRPLKALRGQFSEYTAPGLAQPVPVLVTYHPAYLLRSPGDKRKAWEDLKLAMRSLGDGR